ncbi:MAG TPA: cache domain-containing protein [Candidatus Babeliales bacterium]|nr:cache domain-containing protein [Candidatus Babeliales bacterium]
MNQRIIGLSLTVICLLAALMWLDKTLFAAANGSSLKEKHTHRSNTKIKKVPKQENIIIADDTEDEIATDEFDVQQKQKEVRNLLDRGIEFCTNNTLSTICHAFTHTKDFIEGELYLFLLDTKGVVYAHGEQEDILWQNLWNYRDRFGALIMQSIAKTAKSGSGWLTYEWCGAVKVSFIQKITIQDKEYIIGCGYYPHSKKYATIGLVKGAVSLFNQDVAAGRSIDGAFSSMGYSLSDRFIYGDLYLYALDFNGLIRAQGEEGGLIGVNALEYKDSKGKAVNKEIIAKLKTKDEGEGVWFEYTSKNALKYAYAEKVKDNQGNYYFIACGYYPEIDRDKTVDLVRRGYQYMKSNGVSAAKKEFSEKGINTYHLGDLYLFVYDMKGKCIAHGGNSSLIGQNQFDEKDQDGRYYIREMIDQARAGGGWVDFKIKNSFQSTYIEKVDMGVDTYFIGSGMFPVTKPETMALLVKSALGYLHTHSEDETFAKFVDRKGAFIRGDLFIFAFDFDGYCYAWGDNYELIWKNIIDWKDDENKLFIKNIIEGVSQGPDHFVYKFNKRMRVDYVEQIEKNGKKYCIGSGFYK